MKAVVSQPDDDYTKISATNDKYAKVGGVKAQTLSPLTKSKPVTENKF